MLDTDTKKSPVAAGLSMLDLCPEDSTERAAHTQFSRHEAFKQFWALELPCGAVQRTRQIALRLIAAASTKTGCTRSGRPYGPGHVFLGVSTLADDCQTQPRLVRQSLRDLEALGILQAVSGRSGGRGNSTMYRVCIGWREAVAKPNDAGRELRAELAARQLEIERLRAELAAERSGADGDSEIVVSRSEQQSEPETRPQKPNAARWVRKLIAAAYQSQLRDRYGIGHTRAVKETTMALYVSFAERMSIELVTDIRDVVESTVRIYFDQPGKDSRLREQCHPLGWMEHDLATIERQLRREHRRKKRRRAPPAAEETPRMTPREAATRAAQIAAAIKRSAA